MSREAKDEKKLADILSGAENQGLKIVEFCVGDCHYGINVTKIREIIRYPDDIVAIPDSHDSLEGAINLRGRIIPVINLERHLKTSVASDKKISRIVVSEFNQMVIGFLVSSVTRIHQLSQRQVEAPSDLVQSRGEYALAIIKIDDRILFLLDFEKIAADITLPRGHAQDG